MASFEFPVFIFVANDLSSYEDASALAGAVDLLDADPDEILAFDAVGGHLAVDAEGERVYAIAIGGADPDGFKGLLLDYLRPKAQGVSETDSLSAVVDAAHVLTQKAE